jgi:hypothetical protein
MFRVITNDGGSTKLGWAMVTPKNKKNIGKNRSKRKKQIKIKKQRLVLILDIWLSPKDIRALNEVTINVFGPILDILGYRH